MAKKNITTEELALMIGKGFSGVDKKFAAVDKKMDMGFKQVHKRLDRIENILIEKHSDEIRYLKERVGKLEDALAME